MINLEVSCFFFSITESLFQSYYVSETHKVRHFANVFSRLRNTSPKMKISAICIRCCCWWSLWFMEFIPLCVKTQNDY